MSSRTATIALILATGCATPVPPSGGPTDETPPELVEATPEQGAVNVDARTVRFTFSEHVDEASFTRAFSISPSFEGPVDFSWSGRSVVVRFPEPLRENTTYVLTIDTNLLDIHRVALSSPIVYAFSTGPTISAGALAGRVVASSDGTPVAGVDVLAYARPDSTAPDTLDNRPAYRTQTDSEGIFSFEYLTEQFYYVPALQDENRNLKADTQEPFATPPSPAFFADTTAAPPDLPWILSRIDTTAPTPLRAQSSARSHHVIRFSEPVRFLDRDPDTWHLADSSTGTEFDFRMLYLLEADPRDVHVVTTDLESGRYRIVPAALADTSGNVLASESIYFTPAQNDDTLQTRFLDFLPSGLPGGGEDTLRLPHEVEPGLRFNRPISEDLLSSAVAVTDSTGADRTFIAVTENGTDYEILTEPRLMPGERVIVAVDASRLAGDDTTFTRSYQRISAEETGEIAGVVRTIAITAETTVTRTVAAPVIVDVFPVDVPGIVPTYTTAADSVGSFVFSGLPAGSYRLRAFADVDSSGTWDPGLLMPYRPGEGLTWHNEPVRVRSRWETALPDTLQIQVRP